MSDNIGHIRGEITKQAVNVQDPDRLGNKGVFREHLTGEHVVDVLVQVVQGIFEGITDISQERISQRTVEQIADVLCPILKRASRGSRVVCIPNISTFRAFRSLCVSLCLLARLYTAIHRPPAQTHLHASQAPGPNSFRICLCPKHVSHTCLTLSSNTRVFQSGSGAGLHPWIIQLSQLRIYKHYGGS